jgi:hypothetical protein
MSNKNERYISRTPDEIQADAERVAKKLKENGWEDSPDNPHNEMSYKKNCSDCNIEFQHRLTKTAYWSVSRLEEAIDRAKMPEKCVSCKNKK